MSEAEVVSKPGEPVMQFSLFLENRVGALQRIVQTLENLKVNVLGISVQDSVDVCLVRMIVSDPDITLQFFSEKGIPYSRSELLAVELPLGAADLGKMMEIVSNAETNIDFLYPLLCCPRERPVLALHTNDVDVARAALHGAGFKVLFQEELSR